MRIGLCPLLQAQELTSRHPNEQGRAIGLDDAASVSTSALDDVIADRIVALYRARGHHPEPDGTLGATRNGDAWLAPRFRARCES